MRLTCPNCDAQYKVSDTVIPTQGRDVQCSNCNYTWFQALPDKPAPAQTPPPVSPGAAADMPPPPRRKLDPAVSDILRQEAEHEARLRRGETDTPAPEAPDPVARAREARARVARIRGKEPVDEPPAGAGLPDANKISSTLRASDDVDDGLLQPVGPPRSGGGFTRGFSLMVIVAALLAMAYFNARPISQAVPQVAPYVKIYVARVDQARVWLDTLINQYMPALSEPLE